MLIPIAVLFFLFSAVGLGIGLRRRNAAILMAMNAVWWAASCVSGYFVWLAWLDRGYSENWAMIGVIFFSAPAAGLTLILASIELALIRKWKEKPFKAIKVLSLGLLMFLLLQIIVGLLIAR